MKKVFLSLAVVAMFSFVACGGNEEATVDTTAQETEQIAEPAEPVDENAVNVEEMAEDATAETETVAE